MGAASRYKGDAGPEIATEQAAAAARLDRAAHTDWDGRRRYGMRAGRKPRCNTLSRSRSCASGGVRVLNDSVVDTLGIDEAAIARAAAAEKRELERRKRLSYEDFSPTSDDEVRELIARAETSAAR